jgi:autotransporter-associated beta strand protein
LNFYPLYLKNKEIFMKRHASLNRIYRVIWSQVLNAWVAVAETAKGRSKSANVGGAVCAEDAQENVAARIVRSPHAKALLGFASAGLLFPCLALAGITNGNFENSLTGWTVQYFGGANAIALGSGVTTTTAGTIGASLTGDNYVYTSQAGAGLSVLSTSFVVPSVATINVFADILINNGASAFYNNGTLSYTGTPNQYARFDILIAGSDPTVLNAADIIASPIIIDSGSLTQNWTTYQVDVTSALSGYVGQSVIFRYAQVDNQLYFNLAIDNVNVGLTQAPTVDITTASGNAISGLGVTLNRRFDGGVLTSSNPGDSGDFTLTGNGGTIDVAGTTSTFSGIFSNDQANTPGNLTISNSGSGGAVTLSGQNIYTGLTTINSGASLALSGSGSIADSSGVTDNGNFDISAVSGSGALIKTLSGNGTVTLGAKTLTLTNANNDNFSGSINGNGAFALTGGTETLSGTNTYLGGSSISGGGILKVSADTNLGDANGTLTLNGGTLENTASFATARDITLGSSGGTFNTDTGTTLTNATGIISGSGVLNKTGAGTLILGGTNTYQGGTSISGGILQVSADTNLGNASGALTLNGATLENTASFSTARDITLGSSGGTFNTDSGTTLTDATGIIGGSGALNKTGAGTLILGGSNTYQGGTNVSGGILQVSADANLGNASGALSLNGATLENTASFSTGRDITLGSGGGTINTDSGTTLTDATGIISGSGALNKAGAGTLILGGANTYQGGTSISGGILQVSADTNLGNASGALTLNGGILENTASFSTARDITLGSSGGTFNTDSGTTLTDATGTVSGSGALNKTGAGTLILGGINTYQGGTNVSGGILQVTADANLGNASGALSLNGGTLENAASFSTGRDITLGSSGGTFNTDSGTTLTDATGTVSGSGALNKTGAGTLILGGSNTYQGGTSVSGGILKVSADTNLGNASGALSLNGGTLENTASFATARDITLGSSGGTFTTDTGTTLTDATGIISGSGVLNKTGAGTLILGGTNTYQGGTNVSGGLLQVSADANLGNASGALTLNGATLENTASFATGRDITLGSSGGTFTTDTGTTLTNATGIISGSGALNKTGAGTLILGGTNTYQGGTNISGGILQVSADTNLGNASGAFTLNGATIENTASFSTARDITLGSSGGTFTTDTGTTLTNATGIISGSGALNKTGAGTLMLGGVLSQSGGTVVNAGTLVLSGGNSYSGGTLLNGGTLSIGADNNLGSITGNPLVFNGGTLQSTATFSSARNISLGSSGGTISTDTGSTLTDATGSVSGTGALNKAGAGTLNLGGVLSQSGGTVVNAGTLILSGSNTYSGGTTLNGGTLSIGADNNLGASTGNSLAFNGGTLQNTATFSSARNIAMNSGGATFNTDPGTTLTLNGILSGSGGMTKIGTGTLILAGDNAGAPSHTRNTGWTGDVVVEGGLVQVTNPWGLGWGNITVNGGTINTTVDILTGQTIALAGGATVNTDAGTITTLTGTITTATAVGANRCFVKLGSGTLNMNGSATLVNGTCVQQGTLSANGTLNSSVTVNTGAILGGSGTINGNVNVSGTLSPGNSPGQLLVTSTVTQLTGSTYRADIAGVTQAFAGSPADIGYYSFLQVTNGGQFIINAGASLTPRLQSLFLASEPGFGKADYVPSIGGYYRIVTAAGGVVGRFSTLIQPAGLAANTRFAAFYNVFGNNSIDLTVLPSSYSQWLNGGNANTRSVATVLDQILAADQSGNSTTAQNQLLYVTAGKSAAQLPGFARSLSGEVFGALAAVTPQAGQWLQGSVVRQLAMASANDSGAGEKDLISSHALWVDAGGSHSAAKADDFASGYSNARTQFSIGVDVLSRGEDRLGFGISHAATNVSTETGSGRIDENMLFTYGQYAYGRVLLDGIVGYGTGTTDSQRADPTGLSGTLKSTQGSRNALVSTGVRMPWQVNGSMFESFARVMWQQSRRNAFTEGNAVAALTFTDYAANGVRTVVGVSGNSEKKGPLAALTTWQFSLGVGQDRGSLTNPAVQGSLAGMSITTAAPQVGRNFAQANLAGTYRLSPQAFAFGGLAGEGRSGRLDYGINAGVRLIF